MKKLRAQAPSGITSLGCATLTLLSITVFQLLCVHPGPLKNGDKACVGTVCCTRYILSVFILVGQNVTSVESFEGVIDYNMRSYAVGTF